MEVGHHEFFGVDPLGGNSGFLECHRHDPRREELSVRIDRIERTGSQLPQNHNPLEQLFEFFQRDADDIPESVVTLAVLNQGVGHVIVPLEKLEERVARLPRLPVCREPARLFEHVGRPGDG